MSGRALLNMIEVDMLDGLDPEQRALVRWSIHDPAGFLKHQQEENLATFLAAGGEL